MEMDDDGACRQAYGEDELDLSDKGKEAMQTLDVTDLEQSDQHMESGTLSVRGSRYTRATPKKKRKIGRHTGGHDNKQCLAKRAKRC